LRNKEDNAVNPARYPMNYYPPPAYADPGPEPPRIVFVSIQRDAPPPLIFAAGPMDLLQSALRAGAPPHGAWFEAAREFPRPGECSGVPARRAFPHAPGWLEDEVADAEFVDVPAPPPSATEPMLPGSLVRQLAFGEFRRLVEPQLKRPELLPAEAEVTCAIQVWAAPRPLPPAQLHAAVFGRGRAEGQFTVLTRSLAERLQLASKLPPRPNASAIRYLHLTVLDDPTAKARPAAPPPAPPPEPRAAIPERYLKPWEFRISREEALYDMREDHNRRGLRGLWARFLRWRRAPAELARWQALLQGRAPEDQLWAVRPPACAFHDPEARQWISQVLAACGYQAGTMLAEWEIYWRRKAL
jgi:hypothetical protein